MGFLSTKQKKKKQAAKRTAHAGVRLAKLPAVDTRGHSSDESDAQEELSPSRRSSDTFDGAAELLAPVFAYTEIPDEVLVGFDVDLSIWSVVASDSCMQRLGGRKRPRAGANSNQLADALVAVAGAAAGAGDGRPPPTPAAIRRLNLHGAEHITDQALRSIARLCPNLTSLNVCKATKLSDLGLRHVLSACCQLQELHMSYVPSLRGAALTCIAECHLPLRVLSLAGCPNIPDFAFQRVFEACGETLEHLTLSFCDDSVTDATLLALSQRCRGRNGTANHKLRGLHLRDCRQVSDAGIVHIANAFGNLELLDLTRFDLPYKLNDIALLSLAEKCPLLHTLQLSGCKALTDVGMSWLTSGCQAMTHLDLAGCAKITDIGVRAIGEQLLQLRYLSLKNCSRVSDLGLRHIALGCPELHHLDVSGLTLLSDTPCLHTPLYQNGIASIAAHCPKLRHLDLSHCGSIGDATLHTLATQHCHTQLTVLHLNGCVRITSHGVLEILTQCGRQLTTLTLHDCSRVDDHAFDSFDGVLPLLSVLRLGNCTALTDVGIRAVARTNAPLKDLDLSGCGRVSDMAILALTDSPSLSCSLRYLRLRNVAEISETALSWLAERCPKLLLLDLTGCRRIRAFSLQALASCWRFAFYFHGFKGLQPMARAEDRVFIEEYGDCWRAAIRIQCVYRARVARRQASLRREEQLMIWVATKLQSVYRGRQARKLAILRPMQFNKETEAARRIQKLYRHKLAREQAARLRLEQYERRRDQAALCLQSAWRRKRFLERVNVRQLGRLAESRRIEQAAVKLQRLWRGKHARNQVSVLRIAKRLHDNEQAEAATKMQNVFRMREARREANAKRDQKRQLEKQKEQAALTVQKHIRRRQAQRELARRKAKDDTLQQAARCIQRKWRNKKKSVAVQLLDMAMRRKEEDAAAIKLQAAWKRKKGREQMNVLKLVKNAQRQQECAAALKLQTAWRGKRARHQVGQAKQAAMEAVVKQLRYEHKSAALIQAHFRGKRGRVAYKALVLERKKNRWKPIVHPDTGNQFYYNKETGEVRFRRPQDVLDLLPKPLCDNCVSQENSIAHVECLDCGEVYCNDCWWHVHKGGRRKAHSFRVLYDYYGKRVDYGDGEFPSRWPSEIQQDEMDGWALRTYPLRQPVETRGAWEKYVDEDHATGSGGTGSRVWYYNKETEENTYSEPPAWDSRHNQHPHQYGAAHSGVAVEVLDSEWAKYFDEVSGYYYYYNTRTGESTYTRPVAFMTPRSDDVAAERSADGWAKYVDASSGAAYYYHATTGESTYTRPVSFLTPRRGQTPVETGLGITTGSGADGWAKYYDDTQGVYYYYDSLSKTSTFERPAAFATPRVTTATATATGAAALGLVAYVDEQSRKSYAFNPQTTECRVIQAGATVSAVSVRPSQQQQQQQGYR